MNDKLNGRQLVLLAVATFVAMLTLTLPVAQLGEFVGRLLPADAFGLLVPPLVAGALCLVAAVVAAPLMLRRAAREGPKLQLGSD